MTKNEADDWAEVFNTHADEDTQARNQVADLVRANNWVVKGVGDKPPPLNPDGSLAGEHEPDKSHVTNDEDFRGAD